MTYWSFQGPWIGWVTYASCDGSKSIFRRFSGKFDNFVCKFRGYFLLVELACLDCAYFKWKYGSVLGVTSPYTNHFWMWYFDVIQFPKMTLQNGSQHRRQEINVNFTSTVVRLVSVLNSLNPAATTRPWIFLRRLVPGAPLTRTNRPFSMLANFLKLGSRSSGKYRARSSLWPMISIATFSRGPLTTLQRRCIDEHTSCQ